MKRLLVLASLLLFFTARSLPAVEVGGLYEAEVPVPDRGKETRLLAMGEGLQEVLTKVSGRGDAAVLLGMGNLLDAAPRYVQQFRYRLEKKEGASEGAPSEQLMLALHFDKQAVDRLLSESDLPVWGSARPLTLVWLAIERDGRRYLVGADDTGLVSEALTRASKRRALPLTLPLLDLADHSMVNPADVWGGFDERVLAASQRYRSQAVLLGRIEGEVPGDYRARWTLYQGEKVWRWEEREFTFEGLIAGGVGGTAERLSQSFVKTFAVGDGSVTVVVSGIQSLAAYHQVLDYLSGLHGVKQVTARQVTVGQVVFLLSLQGSRENLAQTISLGDTLVKDEAGAVSVDRATGLRYRLLR